MIRGYAIARALYSVGSLTLISALIDYLAEATGLVSIRTVLHYEALDLNRVAPHRSRRFTAAHGKQQNADLQIHPGAALDSADSRRLAGSLEPLEWHAYTDAGGILASVLAAA